MGPVVEAVWSGSTLFAQTCLSENLESLDVNRLISNLKMGSITLESN